MLLGSVAERIVRTSDVPVLAVPHAWKVQPDAHFAPKHILVPVDMEAASAEILRTAVSLAGATHGRVSAVYAWQMPFYFAAGTDLAADYERRETARFESWVHEALRGTHVGVHRVARNGATTEVIREVAAEEKADLVVMATAGRTGIEHFMIGSVTERTVRTVGLPVLTFRRPPERAAEGVLVEER